MKKTLKRIPPLQAGKILAAVYGMASIIIIPFLVLSVFFAQPSDGTLTDSLAILATSGLALALAMAVFHLILGFLTGLIGAWLYNVSANWLGGIQVEIEEKDKIPEKNLMEL